MKRPNLCAFAAAFVAAFFFSLSAIAQIGGGIQVLGTGGGVRILQKTAIAFVSAPTGTMGNNGAITLGTAMPAVYPNVYLFLPAGSVAAGVPAAASWLFATCTTTTACTVFNNTYTTGQPTIPASPTAFVTTGPGAYTGDTGEEFGPTIAIPALSANSALRLAVSTAQTNNANAKTIRLRMSGSGGSIMLSTTANSVGQMGIIGMVANAGATNSQTGTFVNSTGFGAGTLTTVQTNVPTTGVVSLQKATATDVFAIIFYSLELLTDGT